MQSNIPEADLWQKNEIVCGIDEVGRGPFFGPITLGFCVLKKFLTSPLLVDSKTLSEKKRIAANSWIKENSLFHGTISVDNFFIQNFGINTATEFCISKIIMLLRAKNLNIKTVFADHMSLSSYNIQNTKIICSKKGESWSPSIAAASIHAKVYRDELMKKYSNHFPGFELESNMGYGSKAHREKLLQHGISLLHRTNYCQGTLGLKNGNSSSKPAKETCKKGSRSNE